MPWLLSSPGQHQPWYWLCQSWVSQLHYHPCHGWQMPSEVTWAYLPPPLITINIELLTHWWLGHITCYGRQMIDMGINMQNKMVKPFWCWDWNIPCVARPSPTTILIMSATNKPTALPSMPWLADDIRSHLSLSPSTTDHNQYRAPHTLMTGTHYVMASRW